MPVARGWLVMLVILAVGLTLEASDNNCFSGGCHGEISGLDVIHAPAEEDCGTCHESKGEHRFRPMSGPAGELCYQCHDDREGGKYLHGALRMKDCLFCHDPHGGRNRAMVKTVRVEDICFECHDKEDKTGRFTHGPNTTGNCSICHDSHSTNHASLLIAPPEQLCINCHTDKDFSGEDMHMHSGLEDGCTGCHSPHASAHQYQLTETPKDICAICHDDLVQHAADATVKHQAVQENDGCLNCHDPHGSPYDNNLRQGQQALCLSCHDKSIIGTDGKDYNIARIMKTNPRKHGPAQDGNCAGCHNPHGSNNYKILIARFPKKFYTPFQEEKYDLCFECHESELVEREETKVQTNFRNGSQNLHYLHVNRKKGRTCRACHMVHASKLPRHIREETPFGKWDIPIEFERTETGGSCAPGCHKPKKYDRVNPEVWE